MSLRGWYGRQREWRIDGKNESLGELGEARILSRLAGYGGWNARVSCGIGDDCAICRTENAAVDQVFTSDARLKESFSNR